MYCSTNCSTKSSYISQAVRQLSLVDYVSIAYFEPKKCKRFNAFENILNFFLPMKIWKNRHQKLLISYGRVRKSSDSFFSKILEKPSIVQKKMIPHIKGLDFSKRWSKKKFKMADLENSKWPPQKNLILQLRQFSIFFHENFMDWSLG